MEGNSIVGMAGGFIALAIMLGIGTAILGGAVTSCSGLDGAPKSGNGAAAQNADSYTLTQTQYAAATSTNADKDKGLIDSWAHTCAISASQAQAGYSLLFLVSLVVLSAAVIMVVVRLLTG